MHRLLKSLCTLSLLLLAVSPGWAETLTPAPLNPAFLEYQQQVSETKASGQSVQPTGRIPSPVDLSHLAGQSLLPQDGTKAAGYPATYDLRDEGFVSPIKNQDPYGDCWTFAAMASMESTAMKRLGATDVDLSEWELTYYGYVDESDFLVGFADYTAGQFPDPVADCGGDDFRAAAILSRWTGAALEEDVPFGTTPFPTGASPAYHLSDVMFLYYDATTRYAPVTIDNVKYALTNYGVVSVGVNARYGLNESYYFKGSTSASYIPSFNLGDLGVGDADHAVAIVGWDDNFPASNFLDTPPGDGAWIVRNSWGSDWGDGGYYYLSYHDACLDTGAAYVAAPADDYDNIYQHDPLGLCTMHGIPDDATPTTAWMANVFTAQGLQELKALSFYAAAVDSTYEISVFTDVSAGPLGGDPTDGSLALHAQSGTLHAPGYRTVELEDPVYLTAGQTFSVVIKITTPGYDYPLAVELAFQGYSDKATANPGESFFSDDGLEWTDTTTDYPTANLCIKAFTEEIRLYPDAGEELPPVASVASADAAFTTLGNDLAVISDDLEEALGGTTLAGSLQLDGDEPMEYREGSVAAPVTINFDQTISTAGSSISGTLLVAYDHAGGHYDVPSELLGSAGLSAGSVKKVTFTDGCIYDNGPADDGLITDLEVMEIAVKAQAESSPSSGGGGCSAGTLAPAVCLLLVPLTLLRKR